MEFWLGFAYGTIAVLVYGAHFAYYQRNWPTIADETRGVSTTVAILVAVVWPMALPIFVGINWANDGRFPLRYGLKYRWRLD